MDIQKQKQQLREKLLESRSELSEEEYARKSEEIIQLLKEQPEFKKADTIHCYVSIKERNEADTRSLIKELLEQGKRMVVPITDFNDGTLTSVYLDDFTDLQRNKWGVLEPAKGKEASPADLDLVMVPMVGGDLNKNRIGYGKGFYDRFLQQVSCPAIGLLFERCLVDMVPTESFDVSLHKLITEKRVIS